MATAFYEITVRVRASGLPKEIEYTETFPANEDLNLGQVWEAWLKESQVRFGNVNPELVRVRLLPLKR